MKTIFKTITTGKKITAKQLEKSGINVSSYAKEILSKVVFSKKKEEIDLVILTPRDLGFTEYPTTKELFEKAKEQGYELCSAEVGPLLRMEYQDQPNDEWLYIAHEPITDSDGNPGVFDVGRRGAGLLWLYSYWVFALDCWGLGGRFVFRLRKSSSLESLGFSTSDIEIKIKGKKYKLSEIE